MWKKNPMQQTQLYCCIIVISMNEFLISNFLINSNSNFTTFREKVLTFVETLNFEKLKRLELYSSIDFKAIK